MQQQFPSYEFLHASPMSEIEVFERAGSQESYRADPKGAHATSDRRYIPTCIACQQVAAAKETFVEALDREEPE